MANPALAQLRQYAEPGQLAEREIPARETLQERMAAAPWQSGRWRFQPRLSVGDLVYSTNVFDESDLDEQESDLRGSATAGIAAYAPVGRDMVFVTFAGPNYAWWRDNEELRRLNWSYGAALFGLFNRLSTQVSVKRTETERAINNELRIPTTLRQDGIALDARIDVAGPWQIFTSAALSESRYPSASNLEDRAPNLDLLARDEEVLSAGVAYDIPGSFNLGVGWRRVDSQFVDDPDLRSNSGQYPFVQFSVPGNRLQLDGDFGLRLLEFDGPSALEETEEAVGTLRISIDLATRTRLSVYGARDIVYSAVDAGGFFSSGRTGVKLGWGEANSLRASVFAETGSDEFQSANGANLGRVDDGSTYGVNLQVPLKWNLVLDLGVSETTIDSTLDEFDRSRTLIRSTVRLSLPDFPF